MSKAARAYDHADTLSQLHKEQDCSQIKQMSACSIASALGAFVELHL